MIRPIKDIIKKMEKLSINTTKNKEKLSELRKELITQKETLDKISIKTINKIISNKQDNKDYDKYKKILSEKKEIEKNKDEIRHIINKNYDALYYKRTIKQTRKGMLMGGSILLLELSLITLINKNSNHNNYNNINTTEITTEATTEATEKDELTTENIIINTTETKTENTTEESKETTNEVKEDTTSTTTEEIINNTTNETTEWYEFDDYLDPKAFEKGEEIFNTFSPYVDTMEEIIQDPEKRNEALDEAKQSVITLIDFIFYGSEINGITFDELKQEEKEKIYMELQKLDAVIIKYDPDYKEKWGERYSAVKDFTTEKLDGAKNTIINKIGEDKYNEIIEKKDSFVEGTKETGGYILQFIDDKYQDWKNK